MGACEQHRAVRRGAMVARPMTVLCVWGKGRDRGCRGVNLRAPRKPNFRKVPGCVLEHKEHLLGVGGVTPAAVLLFRIARQHCKDCDGVLVE